MSPRAPLLHFGPLYHLKRTLAAWQRISDNEVIHAATYSEIVRNSFDDSSTIIDEILAVEEAHTRLNRAIKAFDAGFTASHQYALGLIPNNQETYNIVFMTVVALYCMERIQFMASFCGHLCNL